MVFFGDEYIILDASSKDHPFGMLPLRVINHNGLLVGKEKSNIIDVANDNKYLTLRNAEYSIDLENGCIDGTGDVSFNDYASVKYRLKIKDLDEDEQDIEESSDDTENEDGDDWDEDEEDIEMDDEIKIVEISNLGNIYNKIKYKFSERK